MCVCIVRDCDRADLSLLTLADLWRKHTGSCETLDIINLTGTSHARTYFPYAPIFPRFSAFSRLRNTDFRSAAEEKFCQGSTYDPGKSKFH